MKIQNISNSYNPFKLRLLIKRTENNYYFNTNNRQLNKDVVCFGAKKYDIDSIINPTNHCAYCGCKVYSEAQIESLAKSMLNSKSHRLQGDIKSILEKLESAIRSEELTFAKKTENREEIEFFKKLLKFAEDKSFLKGDAIFQQLYNIDSDEALELLKKNMHPIIRTVDHVSPQNLEEENNNSDINLVEACYCCNHDLKKGMSFPEFYAMFPSIKENMPPDKFHYAHSNLMSSSASSILSRMSATNLLKYVQRLFGQREETVTRLGSIDFRIIEANSSVSSSIQNCKDEIIAKESEIAELQAKLDSISSDEEYQALIERLNKINKKDQIITTIQALRDRRNNISSALNDLRNPPKKSKKDTKTKMSVEEKEKLIEEYKTSIAQLNRDIETQETRRDDIEIEIMELDERFPTQEMLQTSKNKMDSIISAYMKLSTEKGTLENLEHSLSDCQDEIAQLESEIKKYPDEDFDLSSYTQEEQIQYQRYLSLVEALNYIDAHSSGTSIKSIINSAAKNVIEEEISNLLNSNIVSQANGVSNRKEIQSNLNSLRKQETELKQQINISQKNIEALNKITEGKTLEEAQTSSQQIAAHIRQINDKKALLKIPGVISALKAEIILLQSTIKDLEAKQSEIETLKS